ncbi:hypothetical protein V8C37DRAFT_377533 [Trichoderma ceciliae]
MDPPQQPAPFKCQICCKTFNNQKQLEIHIDSYQVCILERIRSIALTGLTLVQRLTNDLFQLLNKASAHLTPVEDVGLDTNGLPFNQFDGACPHPACDATDRPFLPHFLRHVQCDEICPVCITVFANAHNYLAHSHLCLAFCTNEAKIEFYRQRLRALCRRARMQFKKAMELHRPGVLDGSQDIGLGIFSSQNQGPELGFGDLTGNMNFPEAAHPPPPPPPNTYSIAQPPVYLPQNWVYHNVQGPFGEGHNGQ